MGIDIPALSPAQWWDPRGHGTWRFATCSVLNMGSKFSGAVQALWGHQNETAFLYSYLRTDPNRPPPTPPAPTTPRFLPRRTTTPEMSRLAGNAWRAVWPPCWSSWRCHLRVRMGEGRASLEQNYRQEGSQYPHAAATHPHPLFPNRHSGNNISRLRDQDQISLRPPNRIQATPPHSILISERV